LRTSALAPQQFCRHPLEGYGGSPGCHTIRTSCRLAVFTSRVADAVPSRRDQTRSHRGELHPPPPAAAPPRRAGGPSRPWPRSIKSTGSPSARDEFAVRRSARPASRLHPSASPASAVRSRKPRRPRAGDAPPGAVSPSAVEQRRSAALVGCRIIGSRVMRTLLMTAPSLAKPAPEF